MTELSDELLVAYVDGQLAKDQNRAIEKVLKQDDVVARRAEALQEAHGRLEFAFESILAGELRTLVPKESFRSNPAERLIETEPEPKGWPARMLVLCGIAAGLAGIGLGVMLAPRGVETAVETTAPNTSTPETPAPEPAGPFETPATMRAGVEAPMETVKAKSPSLGAYNTPATLTADMALAPPAPPPAPPAPEPATWQERAAQAHALVSRESLEVSIESQKNPYLLSFQLTKAIGQNVRGPDLRPDGYRFIRAQVLRLEGKPIAQMLYLPESGSPLALYATPGGEDAPPDFLKEGPVGAVKWSEGGIAYLLAAEAGEEDLLRIAEKIRNEPRDDQRLQPADELPAEPEGASEEGDSEAAPAEEDGAETDSSAED
ncbi:anti-sigma factor family protein [Methyloligella solikamskensis]|uniref:Anti-sigma factor family protein n=1 Tax=Methyloligella solikamskensis TaxID=1177756 RepID=A0ABW3JB09_9HYPH